jgi:hypothetical protein
MDDDTTARTSSSAKVAKCSFGGLRFLIGTLDNTVSPSLLDLAPCAVAMFGSIRSRSLKSSGAGVTAYDLFVHHQQKEVKPPDNCADV